VEVWDPKDKPTVFSQIKKAIEARTWLLRVTRYIIYPGILFILVFAAFSMLSGCSYFLDIEPPHRVEPELLVMTDDTANTIACIKLQPECKLDKQD